VRRKTLVSKTMIFVVETEEQTLYVFAKEAEAVANCEGLDVEAAIWLFWDDAGRPLAPEFTVPNKRGFFTAENGKYHLVTAPAGHHADLLEALEHILLVEGPAPFTTVASVGQYLENRFTWEATSGPHGL
jgi:hypothetical protein